MWGDGGYYGRLFLNVQGREPQGIVPSDQVERLKAELTAKLARARARIYEVPISYYGRDYSEGKKIGWRDGVRALWAITRFRLGD